MAMVQPSSLPRGGPPRTSGPTHLAHVDGFRALAAYVVFINHAYGQVWNEGRRQFPPSWLSLTTYSLVAGHLSVTVFIVISGFCLMLPVVRAGTQLRGGAAEFFKRRARRILPPYYGAVAFCLVAIWTIIGKPTGTLWDFPIGVTPVAIISHLALVQDFFATSRINYVFWSIAVEWQIYFLFPGLVASWRRFGPGVTIAIALTAGYALRIGLAHTRVARGAPHFIGLFALGMLAAYVIQSDERKWVWARKNFPWGSLSLAGLTVVCVMTGRWGWRLATERFYVIDLPIALAAMSVLVITSRGDLNLLRRILSWRPLVFIGTFSYSVYLIHAPLLQMLWQYALRPAQLGSVTMFAALMGPGAVAILAASYVFFRVFEAPFMKPATARAAVLAESDTASRPQVREAPAALHDRPDP